MELCDRLMWRVLLSRLSVVVALFDGCQTGSRREVRHSIGGDDHIALGDDATERTVEDPGQVRVWLDVYTSSTSSLVFWLFFVQLPFLWAYFLMLIMGHLNPWYLHCSPAATPTVDRFGTTSWWCGPCRV